MLTNIENRLEELFEQIETMPQDKVEAAEKVRIYTVKFLNFRTPENFAVIYLKLKKRCKTLGYFVKKMQMKKQTVKTLIRLLL